MQGGSCTGVNFVLFLPQIKSWSCTLHLKIVKMHRNLIPWWSLKLVYDKASSQPGSTYTIQGRRSQIGRVGAIVGSPIFLVEVKAKHYSAFFISLWFCFSTQCKPKPCIAHRELPVSQFPQGKPCFHYRYLCSHCRVPVFITGISL